MLGRTLGREDDGASQSSPDAAVDAAGIIRARWEQLRAAGHLDDPVLEHTNAPVRWHVETIAAGALLILLGVIAAIV